MAPAVQPGPQPHPLHLISYRTFAEVVGRLCSFALVVLAARTLDAPSFGWFSLAWASGWLISVLADFGLQLQLTRKVALHPQAAGPIFRQLLPPRLLIVGFMLTLAVPVLAWTEVPSRDRLSILAIVTSHLVLNLVDFINHLFRGLDRSHWEASVQLFQRTSALLMAVLFASAAPNLAAFAASLQLSAWAALVVAGLWAWRRLDLGFSGVQHWPLPPLGRQVVETLPIGLGIFFSALYFRLDLFILEHYWGSAAVGSYHAVFRLVDAARLFPAATMAVVFPLLCRSGRAGALRKTLGALGGLAAVLALGAWLLSEWLVAAFYGPAFGEAVPAFRILLLSLPLLFVNFVLTHQLIADGLERAYAWVCAGGLAASLLLTLLLIPGGFLPGAAWACFWREGLILAGCLGILWNRKPIFEGRS